MTACPKTIHLSDLQLASRDAASLTAAMEVVGTEPLQPSQRRSVSMPKPQAHLLCDDHASVVPAEGPCRQKVAVTFSAAAATPSAAPPPRARPSELDPCLVRLIAVWPRVPQKIRDAISAIVRSLEKAA